MAKIYQSTVIDAPVARVWEILRDFNGHQDWHPAIAQSRIEDGKQADQIGAVRQFTLVGGENVREQLLSLSDADHSFVYTIVESDLPISNYRAEVKLKPVTGS
ncbi:MAG: SRPBCC family protein, partial [Hyphomicrobiales bacterium]|nr:SRPBCC family protein [Hyphomicrobiales bacterium]